MVSPQFHVTFDDSFDTTKRGTQFSLPMSLWQEKTYFQGRTMVKPRPKARYPSFEATQAYNKVPLTQEKLGNRIEPTAEPRSDPPAEFNTEPPAAPVTTTTRSERASRQHNRLITAMTLVANYDGSHERKYQHLHSLLLYKATSYSGILYLNEALAAPDKGEFVKAMVKEV